MHRLMLGLAGLAFLSACSDRGDRRTAEDRDTVPLEVARADTSQTTTAVGAAPDTTRGPAVRKPPAKPRRPSAAGPTPVPTPAPDPKPDTVRPDTAQPYAVQPDSVPRDSVNPNTVASDTLIWRSSDSGYVPGGTTAPPDSPVVMSVPPKTAATAKRLTLPAGTQIRAALSDSIHSRRDTVGKVVTARVIGAVTTPSGQIVVPAGAAAQLTVTELEPAKSKGAADGKLALRVDGISIRGRLESVTAEVQPVPHELHGRGVTGSEVGKVGAGTVVGAVAGRVITGKKKGAVVGGVIGAAGGAVVAAETANRDVVVPAGSPVVLVLREPLVARTP
jgi:hypothetical protein